MRILKELFETVAGISLTGSILIAAVLLLRLFRARFPRRVLLVIWAAVFLKLAFPVEIPSPASIWNRTAPETALAPVVEVLDTGGGHYALHSQLLAPVPVISSYRGAVALPKLTVWSIYGGIAALLILGVGALYLTTALRLRDAQKAEYAGTVFYRSEWARTPMVFGILRPRIYLPWEFGTENEALTEHILLHERRHIRHGDTLWSLLSLLVCCVHFFNPLVWIARHCFTLDLEHFCDEAVVRELGAARKKAYAQSLLACAVRGRRYLPAVIVGFRESSVKKRILALSRYKKAGLAAGILAGAAALTAGVLFATGALGTEKTLRPVTPHGSLLWAQNLNADSILRIEVVRMGGATTYGELDKTRFYEAAAMIRGARGTYEPDPEDYGGASVALYLTMADGSIHSVINHCGAYLTIDGSAWITDREWLGSSFQDFPAPDPLPADFWTRIEEASFRSMTPEDVGLAIQEYTSKGLSYVIYNDSDEEYIYGEAYGLYRMNGHRFEEVQPLPGVTPVFFAIAYNLPPRFSTERKAVDWNIFYGALPDGHYLFTKEISRKIGNYKYEHFTLTDEFVLAKGAPVTVESYTIQRTNAAGLVLASRKISPKDAADLKELEMKCLLSSVLGPAMDLSRIKEFIRIKTTYTNGETSESVYFRQKGEAYRISGKPEGAAPGIVLAQPADGALLTRVENMLK